MLTIVMYHYVRDGAGVPARTTAELEAQLDYLAGRYSVVGCGAVGRRKLPPDACLLTFDDGFREHADVVAPALRRRGLTGCFCVPALPILERRVLDVHKVQFVLAADADHHRLSARVLERIDAFRGEDAIPADDVLWASNTPPHRYDPPETVFLKRILQDGLPERPRRALLDELFAELVSDDEEAFADELYLTLPDVRALREQGFDVAGHGYEHRRLDLLDEQGQAREIGRTAEFLRLVAGGREFPGWAFCYPYGSRSATTVRLLRLAGFQLGLTTDVSVADERSPRLELPRIDTNDVQTMLVEWADGGATDPAV